VERIILPDSTSLVHYMLRTLTGIVAGLHVYPEAMRRNLELTRGLIYSGQLLLALTERGVLRETAYAWIQRAAMRAWETGGDFQALVQADADIRRHLSEAEIARHFSLEHQLRHVDAIFRRVFAEEAVRS